MTGFQDILTRPGVHSQHRQPVRTTPDGGDPVSGFANCRNPLYVAGTVDDVPGTTRIDVGAGVPEREFLLSALEALECMGRAVANLELVVRDRLDSTTSSAPQPPPVYGLRLVADVEDHGGRQAR